jgi:hypothetical protein
LVYQRGTRASTQVTILLEPAPLNHDGHHGGEKKLGKKLRVVQKQLCTDGQTMDRCLVSAVSIFHEDDPHGFHRGMDITRVKAKEARLK